MPLLRALARWFQENGLGLLVGVVLALLIVGYLAVATGLAWEAWRCGCWPGGER